MSRRGTDPSRVQEQTGCCRPVRSLNRVDLIGMNSLLEEGVSVERYVQVRLSHHFASESKSAPVGAFLFEVDRVFVVHADLEVPC
jgi:hypothetical protein